MKYEQKTMIFFQEDAFENAVCKMSAMLFSHWCVNTLRPSDAFICVVDLTIISSDNGLSPGRRQAIIWTNAGILLFGPLGTNFSEILIEIQTFSLKKIHLKMSSAKWRPFCLGLNVLTTFIRNIINCNCFFALSYPNMSSILVL